MLTRDFSLRVKALDDSGTFTGYASTYGQPADLVGDIVEPGAFKQSIQQQGKGYPLLWAHKQDEPVGIAKISDSQTGLVVEGSLLLDDPVAKRAHSHLKAGTIKGLSIGYTLPRGEGKVAYSDDGTRTLKEVHLHEISLVAVPANPRAQVVSVKTLGQIEGLLRSFRPSDVCDRESNIQLRAVDAELKRLLRKNDECECNCVECLSGNSEDCSNDDCGDPNCEGSTMGNAHRIEELAAVKALAASIRSLDL